MVAGLKVQDLEDVWDRLAEAVDRAGPGKEALFLAKLALLLANAIGDKNAIDRFVATALEDLT